MNHSATTKDGHLNDILNFGFKHMLAVWQPWFDFVIKNAAEHVLPSLYLGTITTDMIHSNNGAAGCGCS